MKVFNNKLKDYELRLTINKGCPFRIIIVAIYLARGLKTEQF